MLGGNLRGLIAGEIFPRPLLIAYKALRKQRRLIDLPCQREVAHAKRVTEGFCWEFLSVNLLFRSKA